MKQNIKEKVPGSFGIARIVRKLIHHCGNILRWSYLAYLRMAGVKIGKGTMISLRAKIDVRRGWIVIGNNCTITYGCIIVSHDASAQIRNPGDVGEGEVIIEDDAYIGVGSIILPHVRIGQGSVIGAGSVVTRTIPPNVVALGNPARVIRQIPKGKREPEAIQR
jgi:acetyltransferase-like isoleucine patch superfamily enzyme